MFEKSALRKETKKVRGLLDKKQYPETYAALSEVFITGFSLLSEAKQETTRYAGGDKRLNKNSLDLLQ